MIHAPGMLMIGSAGRNSGKTEFACSLIRRFSPSREIIGVKVTSVVERNGRCPRGGEGCGVCSSLDGPYLITEENIAGPVKDTQRMLAAGAGRVYWLRVLKAHLQAGAEALFERLGPEAITICESNSLRAIVEPSLFFMFRHHLEKGLKESAAAVRHRVDRLVTFTGSAIDIDAAEMDIVEGRWACGANGSPAIGQSRIAE